MTVILVLNDKQMGRGSALEPPGVGSGPAAQVRPTSFKNLSRSPANKPRSAGVGLEIIMQHQSFSSFSFERQNFRCVCWGEGGRIGEGSTYTLDYILCMLPLQLLIPFVASFNKVVAS